MKDPNLLTTVAFREWNMEVGGGDRMGKSFELYVLHFVTHFFILSYFLDRFSCIAGCSLTYDVIKDPG